MDTETKDTALQPQLINSPEELAEFADKHNLRVDWHEPDEQSIHAYVQGDILDNAMGSQYDSISSELNVVLFTDAGEVHKELAVINLASLLAWASYDSRAQVLAGEVRA